LAILKIIKDSDPTLHKKSRKVDAVTPHIIRLLDDMRDTLHDASGCGLAAVQVGVLRRIVLVEVEEGKTIELINPEIIERSDERQQELEGCLSIPNRWGITDRPKHVKVRAMNRDGKLFTVEGDDLAARAFCHEIDHLDGILFTAAAVHMLTDEELEDYRNS